MYIYHVYNARGKFYGKIESTRELTPKELIGTAKGIYPHCWCPVVELVKVPKNLEV
jgi:hypothetical protein